MKYRMGSLHIASVIIIGVVLSTAVGLLDYITGDIGFSIFYLLPIVFVSWFAGLRWGIMTSVLSAILWLLDDISVSAAYSHPLIPYWNMGVRLGFYVLIVVLFVKLKQELERRKQLIAQLKEANSKIRTLRGLLPICAWCKKIRDDKGYWKQLEQYMEEHSEATFTHGICPECYKRISEGEPEEKP